MAEVLKTPPGRDVRLWWLGQAGFVIDGGGRRVVIDPYLSDSLAEKYAGTKFPHQRMMPAPIGPGEIAHVDLVIATHAHTDHMDPGTLPALMAANPDALLLVPRAAAHKAAERAGPVARRIREIDAGETFDALSGLVVKATRAAHEDLSRDEAGNHLFLGMAATLGGVTIFHSGDTIPFDGQTEEVAALAADLALFPVNGRDAERRANGVPGNMTAEEAVSLAETTGIGTVIAHHFGIFAFNTVDPAVVSEIAAQRPAVYLETAKTGFTFHVSPRDGEQTAE